MALLGLSPQHIQDVTEYKTHLEKLQRLGLIKTDKEVSRTTFPLRIQPDVLKLIIGKKEYHRINRIKKSHHRFRDFGEFGRRGEISIIYKPKVSLDRVVLNENDMQKVLFFIAQWKNREKLFKAWGFDDTIHNGKGASILLSGPSGVGKTLLAEAIAYELGMKLSFVDYSKLVDCLVGETSKNISDTFKTAKEKKAVLFFDEADALVSARGGILRSVDKEFNREVNVFLQEIEKFEGVVILTTNLASNLDRALERRLALKLQIPPPGEKERVAIWQKLVPKDAPLENDVSFEELAKKFNFTGGQIKNAVLNAARFAIARKAEKSAQADFIQSCMLELEGKNAFDQSIYAPDRTNNKNENKDGYI
ncbi:MAG: ATP-binding protein [Thermoplasmata archaeon]